MTLGAEWRQEGKSDDAREPKQTTDQPPGHVVTILPRGHHTQNEATHHVSAKEPYDFGALVIHI
jgi:hypothetical protein